MGEKLSKCGAHCKSTGEPCKNPAGFGTNHVGTGRCKYHGGATPKGQRNNLKHGIYANCLFDNDKDFGDEKKIWTDLDINTLEDEIRLCKLRLRRAAIMQKKIHEQQEAMAAMELDEVQVDSTGKGDDSKQKGTKKFKRTNYERILNDIMLRLTNLIATQAGLNNDDIDPKEKAKQIKDAILAMEDSVPPNADESMV